MKPDTGSVFTPVARGGYQTPALSLDFPSIMGTGGEGESRLLPGIRLDLKKSNCWVGGVALDMKVYGAAGIFLGAETNVAGNMPWESNPGSIPGWDPPASSSSLVWKGSDFEWMAGEVGVSYAFGGRWDARLGVRLDDFSVDLRSPVVTGGSTTPPDPAPSARGEYRSRLWLPYGAIRFCLPGSRATLAGSPLLYGDMSLAYTNADPEFTGAAIERSRLSVPNMEGYFLEASAEHRVRTFMGINVSAWARVSLIKSRSPASLQVTETEPQAAQGDAASLTGADNASVSRQTLGGGLSAILAF